MVLFNFKATNKTFCNYSDYESVMNQNTDVNIIVGL